MIDWRWATAPLMLAVIIVMLALIWHTLGRIDDAVNSVSTPCGDYGRPCRVIVVPQ